MSDEYRQMIGIIGLSPDPIESAKNNSNNYNISTICNQVDNFNNPIIVSPTDTTSISFWETKESMTTDVYKKFLDNVVARFRHSVTYKSYKEYLYELGLGRCQVLGINSDMVTIEMHHNFLTLFDIAFIITEHILNTIGFVDTFVVIKELKRVHTENKVPIVMISKSVHQMFHANKEFVLPGKMCFGYWTELLKEFNKGLSLEISYKILNFIEESIQYENKQFNELPDHELLALRDNLKEWNYYNECTNYYTNNNFMSMVNNNYSNQYYLSLYNQTYQLPQYEQ